MSESRVAARYAHSLLGLAVEQNKLDLVNNDIILFLQTCDQCDDLVKLFRNPVIKTDKKLNIVNKIFSGKVNELTLLFLQTIIKKSREYYMLNIARQFRKEYNDHMGIASAFVTTAVHIDDKLQQEIRSYIAQQSGKKIELQADVDPAIIGGLVIRLGDKLFDASISGKLASIKKKLSNAH